MELQDLFLKLQEGDFTFFFFFYKNVVIYKILSYTKNYDICEEILHDIHEKFVASITHIDNKFNT